VAHLMVSTSEAYCRQAIEGVRDRFGPHVAIERVAADLFLASDPTLDASELADACVDVPMPFIRHVTELIARVPADDRPTLEHAAQNAIADSAERVAVQAWAADDLTTGWGPADAARLLSGVVRSSGRDPVRAGTEEVLSCFLAPRETLLGWNRTADSLSDWPGGRVRLSKGKQQVSRAEFKLEELAKIHPLHLPASGRALDLGAAPGGWTRILRQYGLDVWAVDPAELDPRVTSDRRVHHVAATADDFLRRTDLRFDVVVNDMRMDPRRSAEIMVAAAERMHAGATAIVTLKLGTTQVTPTLRASLAILRRAYDVTFLRQLHHNRQEITAVLAV
jgi:23S rRNA (cytidine2498-2'-O)-methyltransferase